MHTENFKQGKKGAAQVVSHDGWIKRNLLKAFATLAPDMKEQPKGSTAEPAGVLQKQSWVPWPAYLKKQQ